MSLQTFFMVQTCNRTQRNCFATMIGLFHGLWFTISSDNHNIYMNHNPGHNMMWQKWQLFKSRTALLYWTDIRSLQGLTIQKNTNFLDNYRRINIWHFYILICFLIGVKIELHVQSVVDPSVIAINNDQGYPLKSGNHQFWSLTFK